MISDFVTINDRLYDCAMPIENELQFEPHKSYIFSLSHLALIKVEGSQALNFLQGQLTNDICLVNEKTMRQAAMCNLQGRILALVDVIHWQDYNLLLPSDLVSATLASLTKTAALSRLNLQPRTECKIYGLYTKSNVLPFDLSIPDSVYGVSANNKLCCYRLAQYCYLILTVDAHADLIANFFHPAATEIRGSLAWHYLLLKQKLIQIYPSTRGLFLPHRLELHLNNFISFDKGCYKGQEIIARTHYRAKLKHSLRLFYIKTNKLITAGMKLFAANDNHEIGELVDFCPVSNDSYLIAVTISITFNYTNQVRFEQGEEMMTLNPCQEFAAT